MMLPYLDPTIILMIPGIILSMYAQFKVTGTFNKFSNIGNKQGYTGADVARMLLERSGIYDVNVEHVSGNLTDHYDPRSKVVRLSDSVYNSRSLSAIGVAAHEVGHAVQHNLSYAPLAIRSAIAPAASFSGNLSLPLIIAGMLMASFTGSFGILMLQAGIVLFAAVLCFQVVTLPVEFNASSRALEMLSENRILFEEELKPAKKVLGAAALTYVAAVIVSLLTLLRYLIILGGLSRNDE